MGVIYKLHPKIRDFILQSKQEDPNLSCRGISSLISDKFQLRLSKSRVNFVIKQAGLSMPVGRRKKERRNRLEADGLGAILLKAADYLIGGKNLIVRKLQALPGQNIIETEQAIERQLYRNFFDFSGQTIGRKLTAEESAECLNKLQKIGFNSSNILGEIGALLKEIRVIKFELSNNNSIYLDGKFHTVWSSQKTPKELATTNSSIMSYIKDIFNGKPIVLSCAPGYDTPSQGFFDFLKCAERHDNKVARAVLFDRDLAKLQDIPLEKEKKLTYVFGLWPWQFGQFRNVNVSQDFKQLYFEPQQSDYYIAESSVELIQPVSKESVKLRGCALKTTINDKIKLIILTNVSGDSLNINALAELYLSRWPNLEEGYLDLSKKIELSTYSDLLPEYDKRHLEFKIDNVQSDISTILEYYISTLDQNIRLQFFPPEFARKDFAFMNNVFYGMRARIILKKRFSSIVFLIPKSSPYHNSLNYACARLNEENIEFFSGKKAWFSALEK